MHELHDFSYIDNLTDAMTDRGMFESATEQRPLIVIVSIFQIFARSQMTKV